jgi:hypothetical protein
MVVFGFKAANTPGSVVEISWLVSDVATAFWSRACETGVRLRAVGNPPERNRRS